VKSNHKTAFGEFRYF